MSTVDVEMVRSLWHELHLRPLTYTEGDNDQIFICQFANKLPRYLQGCPCNEFFNKYRTDRPPVFTTRDEYFKWTWVLHNAVNAKLSKPLVTLKDAKAMYLQALSTGEFKIIPAAPASLMPEIWTPQQPVVAGAPPPPSLQPAQASPVTPSTAVSFLNRRRAVAPPEPVNEVFDSVSLLNRRPHTQGVTIVRRQ